MLGARMMSVQMSAAVDSLFDNLLAWFPMEEAAGSPRVDLHNSYSASEIYAPASQEAGKRLYSAGFNKTQYLNIAADPEFSGWNSDTTSFSAVTLVYTSEEKYTCLASLYQGNSVNRSWYLLVDNNSYC